MFHNTLTIDFVISVLITFIVSFFVKITIMNIINFILFLLLFFILFINVNVNLNLMNKYKTLEYVNNKYKPTTILYNDDVNIEFIHYPVIFKPIYCSGMSNAVTIINTSSEAYNYIQHNKLFLIQEFIEYDNEVSILYEKNIISNKGFIISMVKKNDTNTIKPGCGVSFNCTNLTDKITPELSAVIDKISNQIPNFNAGRYDIKYKNEESLLKGKDFYILEVNDVFGTDLRRNYLNFWWVVPRWFLYRLMYGLKNVVSLQGFSLPTDIQIIIDYMTMCN